MDITLIRHGESEYNRIGLLQGRIDCNLSEYGIKQTQEKAKIFDCSKFDLCFCSPLKRTRQAAEILVPQLKIIYDERIIERSLGDLESTPNSDEKQFLLKQIDSAPTNGESINDIQERVNDFINFLKENYSAKKILVITHAGVIYAIQRVLNLKVNTVKNLEEIKIHID